MLYKRIVTAFFIFFMLLSIIQFTVPHIIGFDGYFNIKAADIIKKEGLIKEFPWAGHTILAESYSDTQFLFRVFLIPFTFFDLEFGAKIASILFAAICFTVFYFFLLKNDIKYAFFWALLYLFSSANLMYRFMETRQLPLAIALIILTIHFLQNRKYLFLGIISFAFVWLYSGFIIQLFIVLVYIIIERIFSRKFDYKIILYSFLGVLLGLVINPYFPGNIPFLYAQVFKVNLLSNLYNVEWKPWTFIEFVKNNILILFYLIASLFILIKNKKIDRNKAFYLFLALFFLIYTIKTRRMHEYLIPFAILSLAFFFKDYSGNIDVKYLDLMKKAALASLIIIISVNFILAREEIANNTFLYDYEKCAEWMMHNVSKNSLVFNNAYTFTYLFFKNSDLRYTHGLDLTYSYLYDAEEFERYIGILQGTLKSDADYIIEDYNPDYLISGKLKQDVQLFNYIVKNRKNYKAVYEDEWCAVLEVK